MNKLEKKESYQKLFLVVLFLTFTFFVFGPASFYLTNGGEFWFSFSDVLPICIVCALTAGIALFGLGVLLQGSLRRYYVCLLLGISMGLYIQGNYVGTDYGVLDGSMIDWDAYKTEAVSNTLLWGLCILAPFVLKHFASKVWAGFVKYIPLGILIVQITSLLIFGLDYYFQIKDEAGEEYSLTTYAQMELSDQENTIVFVLDCYDAQYFTELLEKHPVLKTEILSNFTYYPDTVAGATRTVLAMPYILTGQAYTDENGYENYIEKSFSSAKLYKELQKRNYNAGIYTEAAYVSPQMSDLVVNLNSEAKQVGSYSKLAYYLYKLTAFRYFPHVLKEQVWMYTGEFDAVAEQNEGTGDAYVINDPEFFNSLMENKLVLNSEKNAFRVYHLNGAHEPYRLNVESQWAAEGTSLEQQQLGVWNILRNFFEQMKLLGIYEHSNIIVMADHGGENHEQNPLFLVKYGMETEGFTVGDAAVSYENLHPTLLKMLGADPEGKDVFELTEEDNVQRLFYVNEKNEIVEYIVSGNAADPEALSETGNRYSMLSKAALHKYVLGTEVYFDARATGIPYIISGFRGVETTHTWTIGKQATIEIPLKKKVKEDLFVQIDCFLQMLDAQRVGIYINDHYLGWYNVTQKQLDFIVPKDMVDTKDLKIRLELPDAVLPEEAGETATDSSALCLAFYSLVVREVQASDVETDRVVGIDG